MRSFFQDVVENVFSEMQIVEVPRRTEAEGREKVTVVEVVVEFVVPEESGVVLDPVAGVALPEIGAEPETGC
jgi:hypothetical protein